MPAAEPPGGAVWRLRWRLMGAWRWPAFAIATPVDALLLHLVPPLPGGVEVIPGLIISSFANLFLIGAVAPWLTRRLADRAVDAGGPPVEVLGDRIATTLLGLAVAGLLVAGLGSRPIVVSETKRTEAVGPLVRAFVERNGTAEVRRNLDAANTHPTQDPGFFRVCIPFDDRTLAYCMYVDVPARAVEVDPDHRSNGEYFGESGRY